MEKGVFSLKAFLEAKIAPPKDSPQIKAQLSAEQLVTAAAIQHRRQLNIINSSPGNPSQGIESARISQPFSQVLEGIIASPASWSDEELVLVAKAIASRLLVGAGSLHRVHYGSLQGLYPLLNSKGVSAPIDVVVKKLWEGLPKSTGTADVSKEVLASVQAILAVAAAQGDRRILQGIAGDFLRRFPGLPDGFIAVLQETVKYGSLARRPWERKTPRSDLRPRAEDKAEKLQGEEELPRFKPASGPAHRPAKKKGLTPEKNPDLFTSVDGLLAEEEANHTSATPPATAPLGEVAQVRRTTKKKNKVSEGAKTKEVPYWREVVASVLVSGRSDELSGQLAGKFAHLVKWDQDGGVVPPTVPAGRPDQVAEEVMNTLAPPPSEDYSNF